ncbi:MAG: ATP-dependent DNA helicase RecG [Candidatus Campbellbacteria bacterium]|nr:ATP-dependent DNA helicase RecG [Candidatus Campbellbacteria bacterium]
MSLSTSIEKLARIDTKHKQALERLGISSIRDLLYHFPYRYENTGTIKRVQNVETDDHVTLYGYVSNLNTRKSFRAKTPMAEGVFGDQTGSINLIWFNQPYIAKMISENTPVEVEGKVSERNGKLAILNPRIEKIEELPALDGELPLGESPNTQILNPIYPTSKGATSQYIKYLVRRALRSKEFQSIEDPVPEEVLERYSLPDLKSALIWIHEPKEIKNAEVARKRMSFEEILAIQIDRQRERARLKELKAFSINKTRQDIEPAIKSFGFKLTKAQEGAIETILSDLSKETPMSRLLEGDVGSGKTVAGAAAMYASATTYPDRQDFGALQSAYMVPTEILAEQQFKSFCDLFRHTHLQVGLITGSGCKKFPSKINPDEATNMSRAKLLKLVKNGEIAVLVGTHSLIQKSVEFKHLALVIIDEQHRFGTKQRQKLAQKNDIVPHFLSMTATPIPRTLALTIYGDLDLSIIDQMPKGRKPVKTKIVTPNKREKTYEDIRKELESGRQMYILCPRIDEPDPAKENAVAAKSVKEESKRIKKDVFPEYSVGELHGKMTPKEKDKTMRSFAEGEIDILVTTSVIEVGVNVPNATVIVIEGAERFGLAQLHQLRGRVARSTFQSFCYVFTESSSQKTIKRLRALEEARSGFELAEYDLEIRGAGELYGRKQSGISDIGMEAIKNIKMVEAAREEAQKIVSEDRDIKKYPLLKERINTLKELHFE